MADPEKHTVQDGLMALYYETGHEETGFNPEFAPIYSGLKPADTEFQIDALIARGGMKTIFRIFNPKTARYAAMARLNPDSPEELYEPFLREARLTAQLDHPNIIKVYDIGLNADRTPYFIMELKTGDRLDQLIERSSRGWKKGSNNETISNLLSIFLKICDAIDYAHSQKVLHLDLKPQNIQVGKYGEVVVCDWGLGKLIGNKEYDGGELDRLLLNPDLLNNMTLSGRIKGTPGYMAPEQAGNQGDKTIQTDIYSLGAILYSMLTNSVPVDGDSPSRMLENTRLGNLVPASERCPGKTIPHALSAIALKALALNPKQRYSSVGAMRQDLINYLNGFSTSAENAGFFREVRLFYLRQKKILNATAVFALLLFIAVSAAFYSINQNRKEAVAARNELQIEKEERIRVGRDAAPKYFNTAVSQLSDGRLKGAIQNFETALALDPRNSDNLEYHNLLASLYFMQGKHEKANRTFWEFPQSIYRKLHDLNKERLKGTLSEEEELQLVEELLRTCSQIQPTPLTTALFTHWALDGRPAFRTAAYRYFPLTKERSIAVLRIVAEAQEKQTAQQLIGSILEVLQASPDWIGRRIPATLGMKLSTDPEMRKQFEALIPANLVLGQKVSTSAGAGSHPDRAVDHIVSDRNFWTPAPLPAQIDIDLGDVHIVTRAKLFTNDFTPDATDFWYDVLVSTRPGGYTSVVTQTDKNHSGHTENVYEFPPTACRYVRLKIIYHNGKTPIRIKEFELY